MLEKIGHTTIAANNGKEAISIWEKNKFDLILMDLHMPIMNGFIATALIRKKENPKRKHTPIIALTADVNPMIKERCKAVNIDSYVSKPVNIKELQNAIHNIMIKNTIDK